MSRTIVSVFDGTCETLAGRTASYTDWWVNSAGYPSTLFSITIFQLQYIRCFIQPADSWTLPVGDSATRRSIACLALPRCSPRVMPSGASEAKKNPAVALLPCRPDQAEAGADRTEPLRVTVAHGHAGQAAVVAERPPV